MTNAPPPPTPPPPPPLPPPPGSPQTPPPPPSPDALIQVVDASRWFGDVVAVNSVTFSVGPGVTALLGPNGAGKSTMLRMLCGLIGPSRGTVRVLGADPRHDRSVSRQMGVAPQQESLFEVQRAVEFVQLAAALHGLDDPIGAARAALVRVELDPDDPRRLGTYSKGMRQRVKLAQALVHEPRVLLLDEPLSGLDPRQRAAMVELVHHLGEEGCCIVISSHVLDEVERFGSRVLVMAHGRLAASGDFRAIRDLMDDRPHRIRLGTDRPAPVAAALLMKDLVSAARLDGDDGVVVETSRIHELRREVAPTAREIDATLSEFRPLDDDLESVFRYLVA